MQISLLDDGLTGATLILVGIILTVVQLIVSIRARNENRDTSGDPWNGRTLEWPTSSPPSPYNFAMLPVVEGNDAFWNAKHSTDGTGDGRQGRTTFEMPDNSMLGFVISFFSVTMGFALIWHIWWLALIGLAGILTAILIHGWRASNEHEMEADADLVTDSHEARPV